MRYSDMKCGLRVRLPSGRPGTVISFEASIPALEILLNRSVKPKRTLTAKVKLDNGDEIDANIRGLAMERGTE